MENACNFESNVEMGIMIFQNTLEKYKGNIYFALQSYNYGRGLVDSIICIYADEIGSTYDNVVANLNDFGWMKYVKMAHNNPQSFAKMIDTNKYPEFQITADYLNKWLKKKTSKLQSRAVFLQICLNKLQSRRKRYHKVFVPRFGKISSWIQDT